MASLSKEKYNSEEYLLTTLKDLDIGYVKVSNVGTILNHNSTFNKIFGYNPKENLIGTKTLDYWLDSEDRNKFREMLYKNGIVRKYITPLKKLDGEKIFIQMNIKLNKNSKGVFISSEGTFADISERIKTEQKLKVSEEKYRLITENANDLIAVLDDRLQYKYVNKGYELLGYSKEEIYNSQATDLLHPDDIKRAVKAFRKGLTTGTGLEELRVKHKDGRFSWFEVKGKTYRDLNGKTNALLISRDITERKKAEQKLKESEEIYHSVSDQYKMLLESITDGVFVLDKNWDYVMINKTATEMVQMSVDRMIGNKLTVLFPGFEQTQFFKIYNDVMNKRKTKRVVDEFIHPDGRKGYYEVSVYPVTEGILCMARDITEKKVAEQRLLKSEKKYRELLENIMEGYFTLDLKGNFTFVNDYYCKTAGYSKEEIIGENYRLIYDEKTSKKFFKMFNQLYNSGIPLPHTNRAEGLTNRGKQVFLEGLIDLTYDSEGKKVGFYGFARDITKKIISEQKLKESEEILRASLESTADGILVVNEKGQISHTNSKFADMWRIPQDLIDKGDDQKLLDFVINQLKDPEAFLSKVEQLYRSTSEDFDTLYFKDGRIFERISSPLVIDAEIKGRVWSFRNITEAKKSEEALKENERRLKEAGKYYGS